MSSYSDYRESLNDMPPSWKCCRFKDVYKSIKEIVGDKVNDYERLALTLKGVIKRSKDDDKGLQPTDFETYQILKKNDMVFKMIDLQNISTSRVGRTPWDGLVSPAYLRFSPKYDDQGFMYYYFMSLYYRNVFNNIAGDGVRSALNSTDIGNIVCPLPDEKEQKKIVDVLNTKISQIDELILNQDSQIENLKEYKQALITKTVTKGLNTNVCMKDSCVDSIGDIPAHWDLCRAKYVFEELSKGAGISKDEIFADGDIQCIRYGEIYSKYEISFADTFSKTKEEKIPSKVYLNYGDIVFSATGELVEEIGKNVVYLGNQKCLAGGDIIVGRHNEDPEFLNYAMYCSASQIQKSKGKAKLKVVHISATNIGDVIIAIPPIDEQKAIASYLNKKIASIDSIIALKNKKIEELNEYKKSIIYEYVTGKKLVTD